MALLTARCESGELQGIYSGNPEITVFKGIPYAAAPVGPLRWQPPQPAMPWEGILKAEKISSQILLSNTGTMTLLQGNPNTSL